MAHGRGFAAKLCSIWRVDVKVGTPRACAWFLDDLTLLQQVRVRHVSTRDVLQTREYRL